MYAKNALGRMLAEFILAAIVLPRRTQQTKTLFEVNGEMRS
jgi:hypothetical protein